MLAEADRGRPHITQVFMDWYYTTGDQQQQGPVSEADLSSLVQTGTIKASALVWSEGMADWQPLQTVRPDLVGVAAGGYESTKDLSVQAMREGAGGELEQGALHYAGFWIRFGAKIIDGILLQVVLIPLQMLLQMPLATEAVEAAPSVAMAGVGMMLLVSIGVPLLYNGLMIGKYGATLGKMACGLKVVMPDGSPVTMGRGFGRYLGEIVSSLTLNIGYLMAAFDDEKRALHDRIASTRVIRTR